MKYLSICSGIEAATVAFHSLGWSPVAFCEIEAFPSAVLAHHYPTVPNLGDMTKFREWPEELLVEVDMLVGGPPCQAFSVAGSRNSLDDERGNLTLVYVHLIDHIDAIRKKHGRSPIISIYENVHGLYSTKDNAFGCLVGAICGQDAPVETESGKWPTTGVFWGEKRRVGYRTLDAQYFGVAQRRRRCFLIAVPNQLVEHFGEQACPSEILSIAESLRGDTAPSRKAGEEVTGTFKSRAKSGGWSHDVDLAASGYMQVEVFSASSIGGYREGCGTLRASGGDLGGGSENLVVGSNENLVVEPYCFTARDYGNDATVGLAPTMRSVFKSADGHQSGAHGPAIAIAGNIVGREPQNGGHQLGYDESGVSYTLTKTDVHAVACAEVGPTMGSSGPPYSRTGNERVETEALAVAFGWNGDTTPKSSEGLAPTMKSGQGGEGCGVMHRMQVRRLTPVECARLQGFPDDYLDITFNNKPAADTVKYRALGNSMAVPVMEWIGRRIHQAFKGHDLL